MLEPLKFIGVDTLLEDIGRGLGLANKQLVSKSNTALNTLVVKSASVTVNFEMTSEAANTRDDITADIPVFGAKTLSFGTQSFDEKQINRCSITLEIVSVIPSVEAEPPTNTANAGAATANPKPPGKETDLDATSLSEVVKAIAATIPKVKLSDSLEKKMMKELDHLRELIQQKKIADANAALREFALKYQAVLNP